MFAWLILVHTLLLTALVVGIVVTLVSSQNNTVNTIMVVSMGSILLVAAAFLYTGWTKYTSEARRDTIVYMVLVSTALGLLCWRSWGNYDVSAKTTLDIIFGLLIWGATVGPQFWVMVSQGLEKSGKHLMVNPEQ